MLVCLLLVVLPVYGIVGRIGSPIMILRPEVQAGETKTIEKSILVRNVNDIAVNITLTPDSGLEDIVEILDNEFILQPEEFKDAEFIITLNDQYTHNGRIIVSFTPPEGPGIKLSSKITILGIGPNPDEVQENTEENNEITEEIANEENTVNVSIGGATGAASVIAENENTEGPSPIVGIIIFLVIILLGISIFLIARKVVK